jgi:DNA-binding NtrC family response regulator
MKSSEQPPKPRILVLNDDQHLLETRRMLLEAFGAHVTTGRGTHESVHEILVEPADLVLIDATNVGLGHGEFLCETIKKIHPLQPVALLVKAELGVPTFTKADRIIYRNDPRQILREVNELLQYRLELRV